MLCTFQRLIYPREAEAITSTSFMVAVYTPCDTLRDSSGRVIDQVKAVGYCLPVAKKLRFDLHGHWSRSPKHGIRFEVESYDEVIVPTKEGIMAYLTSGQIKGIGPKIASRLYSEFGDQTLEVLDQEPEKLLCISGISEKKLKRIVESYLANRGARDVVAFLTPYGITPNRAVKLYRQYGQETMSIVKEHPYRLCEMTGIGFRTADKIAQSMGFDERSPERVDEALLFTLTEAEGRGHLCLEKHAFLNACLKLLDTPALTIQMIASRAARLLHDGKLAVYGDFVFRAKTDAQEEFLAKRISTLLSRRQRMNPQNLDADLDLEERYLGVRLAPEQRQAVKTALNSPLSIITGGPGTGKTMIQRAILDIYRKKNPDREICCCAPTGRAARRMEQSTGYPASTVHHTLGLQAGEDGTYAAPGNLDADLIVVDEVSMLDTYIAGFLFDAVRPNSQVILIGDADQLPSVGPGAVLSELISSGVVPVARLDKVFRQKAGSRIAVNAKLIRHGTLSLEYGDDFRFIDSGSTAESAQRIIELYLQEAKACGVDNVMLLTPYRQKTETGANALNEALRDRINPAHPGKPEVTHGKRHFRVGDKVMQTRNHDDVNNGDIGYITGITTQGSETTVSIDFGDGRIKAYDSGELDQIDLGYATTVHKSQGGEAKSVIINLQCAHAIMLTRPLIYTAITRGKDRVIIVGERRALCMAIQKTDTEKRGTCLAQRLTAPHEK